ncbi:MAG: hypothetical protein JNM84_08455 [Planctomycetes bacterium]|nr:hypothetical protein [Planctomycetota bacterium]
MRALRSLVLAATVPAAMLTAQVPGNQNGLHLYHQTPSVNLRQFPNFATTGNFADDCLWKILPSSAMKRGTGNSTVTGFNVPVFPNNWVSGTPTNVPDVQFYPTTVMISCFVPDITGSSPIGGVSIGNITLPSAGAFTINVTIAATPITLPNGPTALCYMATPGESTATPSGAVAFETLGGTDPGSPPGCPIGRSGNYDSINSLTLGFGYNRELWLETAFLEPTVQPVRNGATSPNRGYGAYDFVVDPSGTSTLGWHVEALQHVGQVAIPLISFSGSFLLTNLGGQLAWLNPDPLADALIVLGQFGTVVSDGAAIPFRDGAFDTVHFPIPVDATGAIVDVAFFFIDVPTSSIVGVTNTARTVFTF